MEEKAKSILKNIKAFQTIAEIRRIDLGLPQIYEERSGDLKISKVSFPNEGGTLTHYESAPPFNGFIDEESHNAVKAVKRIIMLLVVGINQNKLLSLIFYRKIFSFSSTALQSIHDIIRPYLLKEDKYCVFVREVRRSLKKSLVSTEIIDVVSIILEFDDAYRFRAQDILEELNKDNLKRGGLREIKRLIVLLESREDNFIHLEAFRLNLKSKWRLVGLGCNFLFFNKKLKNTIMSFLDNLEITKVKMDQSDLYHCQGKFNYHWKLCQ